VSVLVRVRVSLGFRDRVRVRVKVKVSLDSPLSCILYVLLYPIFLTPNPRNFSVPF